MKTRKTNVSDFLKLLEKLNSVIYSSNLKDSLNDSASLVINEKLMEFSKAELESVHSKWSNYAIYSEVLRAKNPLWFSTLIDKKAFSKEYLPEVKWLIKNIEPNKSMYECIYYFQSSYSNEDKDTFNSKNIKEKKKELLFDGISNIIDENQKNSSHETTSLTEENKLIIQKYYESHFKKDFPRMIRKIKEEKNMLFLEKLISYVKKDFDLREIDLTTYYFNFSDNLPNRFFISSLESENLKKMLNLGFRFKEDKFELNGDNFCDSLLKSSRGYLVLILLPYIEKIESDKLNKDEQYKLLNLYKNNIYYNEIKQIYATRIAEVFAKNLDNDLKNKEEVKKLKI